MSSCSPSRRTQRPSRRRLRTTYRTTILSDEIDPDRLHNLQADLDGAQVYSLEQVREFASCT